MKRKIKKGLERNEREVGRKYDMRGIKLKKGKKEGRKGGEMKEQRGRKENWKEERKAKKERNI